MKRTYRRRSSHETLIQQKENMRGMTFFGIHGQNIFFQPQTSVQRKCEKCDKEGEKLQKNATTSAIRRFTTPDYISNLNGKGRPLSEKDNTFFSSKMNYDFGAVKVHTGREASASARAIHAKAYTIGNNIVFNDEQYNVNSCDGKKLLAHELAHVTQQNSRNKISRKETEKDKPCKDASVELEAYTNAVFNKEAGHVKGEKTVNAKDCEGCDEDCVKITGTLKVSFNVNTSIDLPAVPEGLSECQQKRVKKGINGPLLAHEKKHAQAFKTFNGKASIPVKYKGCKSNYDSYTAELAENEFQRRKDAAQKKSDALDPFSIKIDLCCKDTPKK